ncbi:hypothetical protein MAQ5080_00634 [Marinomonas aquimarina]|uniref:DUF3015 domain-containing protein n=1 Tax=Marinomonas aquimarina TaxID=295068 RepID=A0A1A8T6T8_9GAMM|nr:DUF3015 domain-containing protein [Marinomonas aquimarina]SBS26837.1 hypothetical protein MAQ5080_00634 [Marinomonas aquimarina]
MKKIILSAMLATASVSSFAAYGPAGCGLGTEVVFQNANEWHEHVLAATTNGTSGNQTFGMTSGTLGCDVPDAPLAGGVALFINDNLEPLAVDSAKGEGETLNALADLIGVESQDKAYFKQEMQANFDVIFASSQVTSQTAYEDIVGVMAKSPELSKYLG